MSIKKKFATAVATAGLLAGIFGSAFVPTAMATTTAKAAYTEIYTKGEDITGKDVVFNGGTIGFYANKIDNAVGGTDYEASTQDLVDDTYVEIAFFETSFRCADGGDDAGAGDCTDGTRYGDDELAEPVVSLKATSSNSDVLVAWGMNEAGDAWGDDPTMDACGDIENEVSPRGAVTAGQYAASDTIADAAGLTAHDSEDRLIIDATGAAVDQADAASDTPDTWVLCLAAKDDEVAATSTISLTVNGVSAGSFVVKAMNAPTSLTASIVTGYSSKIAGDNDPVLNFFAVQAKDKNGTVLNGKSSTISSLDLAELGTEGEDSDDNAGGTEIDAFGAEGAYEYTFTLSTDACVTTEGEDDTGKSYDISFTLDNVDGDADEDLTSNDIRITCGQSSEDARVSTVTVEATTGGLVYEEAGYDAGDDDGVLMFVATVVSANGSAMGEGSGIVCGDFDFEVEFTDDAYLDESDVVDAVADDADGYMADDVIGGTCDLGYTVPGAGDGDAFVAEAADDGLPRYGLFTYTVTANESDLSEPGTDKEWSFSYRATGQADAVTISKVRNAAKTIATITFDGGETAGYEFVYFQVEKANGVVQEFRRRANGDGVATLVLARRNTTVYVYAYAGLNGDESDSIKVRFR